jgi:hypothetical protein
MGKAYTPETAAADVAAAMKVLEGRWKLILLFHLFGGQVRRYSELEKSIPGISQKMLAQQLRALEADAWCAERSTRKCHRRWNTSSPTGDRRFARCWMRCFPGVKGSRLNS